MLVIEHNGDVTLEDLRKVGLQWDAREAAYKRTTKRGDRTAGVLHCVMLCLNYIYYTAF
jgi:hypothetical protein